MGTNYINAQCIHPCQIVLCLQGYIDLAPRMLLEELFYNLEVGPMWNPTIVDCRILQVVFGSCTVGPKSSDSF